MGPEGYHWRVCVEDKPLPGEVATSSSKKTFSWWDVQDPNAKLPIKEASSSQLAKFFRPPRPSTGDEDSVTDHATKVAKGAFKTLGKAMSTAVSGPEHGISDSGPPVSVIAFKLLDLCKVHDDFLTKNHGRGGQLPSAAAAAASNNNNNHRTPSPAATAPRQQQQTPNMRPSAPAATYQAPVPTSVPPQHRPQQHQQQQQQRQTQPQRAAAAPPRAQPPAASANLMDFGASAPPTNNGRKLRHMSSSASSTDETRAERLKREYAQKNHTAQRVWDDIDQRWVEVDASAANNSAAASAAMNGNNSANMPPPKKEIGISLDPANAVGKSANVQAAVNARVNEMRESQAKALQEVREREEKKKKDDAEEDIVRRNLEPKIKVWSEEHGKKKQLRALLGTLHTILWPEANWKAVSLGDILDDGKCKRCFHKASRVVHPDKTHHLDAEKRFLAKRIFDSLSQAKNDFDNGAK